MKNEPVLVTGGVAAIVAALITLGLAFGLSLNKDQIAAILGLLTVITPIIAGLIARGHVVPVGKIPVVAVSSETGYSPAVDAILKEQNHPIP